MHKFALCNTELVCARLMTRMHAIYSVRQRAHFYRWHFGCRPPIHLITMHQCRQTNKNQYRNQSSDNSACDSDPVLDQRATLNLHCIQNNSCNPAEKHQLRPNMHLCASLYWFMWISTGSVMVDLQSGGGFTNKK